MPHMTYEETMAWGAAQWAPALKALARIGPAEFTQTGGMNAALVVTLEAGYYLLVTDAEDSLSWSPADRVGWFVGLYDSRTGDVVRAQQDDDGDSLDDLLRLIRQVMNPKE